MLDIIARVHAAGFRLRLTDSGPRVVPVRDGARLPPDLLAEMKANRIELIAHLSAPRESESDPEDESYCSTCSATVYTTSPEVQRMCRMILCPFWTPGSGVGPDWLAKEREAAARRARRATG